MRKKGTAETVWPVTDYRGKIELAVRSCMRQCHWLTFNQDQLVAQVKRGYYWLQSNTDKQEETLGMICRLTCRALIQQGIVVKVKSKLNTTITWQWRAGAESADSTSVIITGNGVVVTDPKSKARLKKYGPVNQHKLGQMLRA